MIFFDVLHPYYLPQYMPVSRELEKRGISCHFIVYQNDKQQKSIEEFIEDNFLEATWICNSEEALNYYINPMCEF